MKIFNTFAGGAMNKDIELRLLPKNFYLDARNVRIATPDAGNSRSVKFALGNSVKSSVAFEGTGATCIGSCVDPFRNLVYWAVATSTHSYILEYNVGTEAVRTIVDDINSSGVFNFTTSMYVEMRVLNDNDNGKNYLLLTDGVNEPKYFEIDTIQLMAVDSYVALDVELIKAPPSTAPSLTLGTATSNNMETKFLSFAYRYKYQNAEWSALSPFSEFAFEPSNFSYNYKDATNSSMFNAKSSVDVTLNTGTSQVSDLQLIVKESGSNTAYIVETYNKSNEGWGDSTSQAVTFNNSRIYQALDANQLTRVFDNVPLSATTLELIGNRIVFGNYTEGYDLEYSGTPINLVFDLAYVSTTYTADAATVGTKHNQVKTNRDYEVAIAYVDGKGRMTTPLTSDGNTTFVPYSVADERVRLRVTINSSTRPPDWATGYRFFIKQSRVDYDVIAPIIFYRDGIYAWVKLEGNDVDKVSDGDFLYVKSDTAGLKATTIRAKVLEITQKDVNFLESSTPSPFAVLQEAGTYMRLQVDDFALSEESVTTHEWIGYSFRSESTGNDILGSIAAGKHLEPIYYTGSGLDDLSASIAAFTGDDDIRFEIEIDGTPGTDTFKWRAWNVTTDDAPGAYTSGVTITGSAQTLSSGVTITFAGLTGHTIGDKWFVSCKAAARPNDWDHPASAGTAGRHAIVLLQHKDPGALGDGETIKAGAVITISYDDSNSETANVTGAIGFVSYSLSSSTNYPNLEEWFYGDNIMSQISGLVWADDINNVMFRRGTLAKTDGQQMTVTGDPTDELYMAFLSVPYYTGSSGSQIRIDNSLKIIELNNNIIFETIPQDTSTDIFYELPYTYSVSGGVHVGKAGDTSQTFGVTNAVIYLDYFNSFGWYNGFESYKIGDTFNKNGMILDTKPLVPIDNYQQINRIASLTYSDTYESTTQFNALNEFNLAEVNYKDMDIRYGPIRKLHARDTDLLVFQHDKTHYVLFGKSVLYNADGTGNITQSFNVLGQEVAYTGEYGIGSHPESFAFFGNRVYHIDRDRGALMRLSIDGYTEISQQGMVDYFRTLTNQTNFVGGYDPYNDEYIVNLVPDASPLTIAFKEQIGFTAFYEFEPERLVGINNRLYSIKDGQIWLHDSNTTRNNFYGTQRNANITTIFNDHPSEVKHFKSVNLETDIVWDATLTTNFGSSTIASTEFSLEEKEYYAYVRQNESTTFADLVADSAVLGIGTIASIATLTLTMNGDLPRALAEGDTIYNDAGTAVGTVQSYNRTASTITLDSVGSLAPTDFILHGKEARVEGESMKGYYMKLQLDSSNAGDNELFAIKVEAVRSSD